MGLISVLKSNETIKLIYFFKEFDFIFLINFIRDWNQIIFNEN